MDLNELSLANVSTNSKALITVSPPYKHFEIVMCSNVALHWLTIILQSNVNTSYLQYSQITGWRIGVYIIHYCLYLPLVTESSISLKQDM